MGQKGHVDLSWIPISNMNLNLKQKHTLRYDDLCLDVVGHGSCRSAKTLAPSVSTLTTYRAVLCGIWARCRRRYSDMQTR